MSVEYLDLEDLLQLCADLGDLTVRDVGLLDAAAQRPRTSLYGDDAYPSLIALSGGGFSTGGYAARFVEDWWTEARRQGRIVETAHGLRFTPETVQEVLDNVLGTALEQGEG